MKDTISSNTMWMVVLFVFAFLTSIGGVVYVFANLFSGEQTPIEQTTTVQPSSSPEQTVQVLPTITQSTPDEPSRTLTKEIYDYNFRFSDQSVNGLSPIASLVNNSIRGKNTRTVPSVNVAANTLVIPKLGINSPIIRGTDGESAIKSGAWEYPSSYDGYGEKIYLCHRRYFGEKDPRSCWHLDQLQAGDIIYLGSTNSTHKYSVVSVSVRSGDDLSILKPSEDDLIKVISCSTLHGSAGSSDYRIAVIARRINSV